MAEDKNAIEKSAVDMVDALEGKADEIMSNIMDEITEKKEIVVRLRDRAKEFISKRFANVLSLVSSKKNLLAIVGAVFLGTGQPWLLFALIALAMVLNTVEKCAYIKWQSPEPDGLPADTVKDIVDAINK